MPRPDSTDPVEPVGEPLRLEFPEQLPVSQVKDEIADAIREHQVVVVAGETGSGKTTQLPKIALEIGRGLGGEHGIIGHTQPRRIAARSVAERIAEELGSQVGAGPGRPVGYQVRFTDHTGADTRVKVMTDGVLLAELQRDRDLRRYDTIIIDEAHERSLNIDFLLGYLARLLPRRPDLKVIITSATIDPQRFADHFSAHLAAAGRPSEVPVIEVSGRTYPVEIRYRPLQREGADGAIHDLDPITGLCEAVEELWTEAPADGAGNDILVFLSGEREIRDAAEAVTGLGLPHTEVVPLFGRLSAAEQHRVFAAHDKRRVILATNVAETSITVPGIRYVIDAGTARISRFSQRTKVQRLPIEPISRASANQRSGRCGRVSDGVAIRLYSEQDFLARPEFTDPEILRTSLASVILQMAALRLPEISKFPFLDPPDPRQIGDGLRLLEELRAIRPSNTGVRLTREGRTMARLPIDPRLARMLIEADRQRVLPEVLVIVAALSIQDPRERPTDNADRAVAAHRRFDSEWSDLLAWTNLWAYLRAQQGDLSSSAFRRLCKAEFLHYLRVREWQDLHAQLRRAARSAGLDPGRVPAGSDGGPGHDESHGRIDADAVHRAMLSGLLSHIGAWDELRKDYEGARGARFRIAPGSALRRRTPAFVMAAELVETSALWARQVARIDPRWAEDLGGHLVKRSYSEPRWSAKAGSAVTTERVTLYGVPLVSDRTVGFGSIDPEAAREMFIQKALVEGDWTTRHEFVRENGRLIERIAALEARTRRRDIMVSDEDIARFYADRLPETVVSGTHFDQWWKGARRTDPTLLTLTEDVLVRPDADTGSARDYPRRWRQGDLALPLSYNFEPGAGDDGVSVHIPLEVLNRLEPRGFDWQVPGLREDLIAALIRTLPKATRRLLVPAPEHAAAAERALRDNGISPESGPLTEALRGLFRRTHGVVIGPGDFEPARIPDHLRITFVVEDQRRRVIARGKDLEALRIAAAPKVRDQVSRAGAALEREGLTGWPDLPDDGSIPDLFETTVGGRRVTGYPALVDQGATAGTVSLRVLPTRAEADAEHRLGVRRLVLLATNPPWRQVLARLTNEEKLALGHNPHGSIPALLEDALAGAVDGLMASEGGRPARTATEFAAVVARVREHAGARVLAVVRAVEPVLATHLQIVRRLETMTGSASADLVTDVRAQLAELIRPGFIADAGVDRLGDLARYLRAVAYRLERAPADLAGDRRRMTEVLTAEAAYADLLGRLRPAQRAAAAVVAIGWSIEELRVSLFAQSLRTAHPVSVKRILTAIDAVDGSGARGPSRAESSSPGGR